MLSYILRRLFWFIPVFFVVTALTFWTVRKMPGGPFDFAGERELPPYVVRNIERKYGLDKPIWKQYLNYMGDLVHLDFGVSFTYRDRDVSDVLGLKFVEVLRSESEITLYRTEQGDMAVLDGEEPRILQPGSTVTLQDGTNIRATADGRIVVERRNDLLMQMSLEVTSTEERLLSVLQGEAWVPLNEGVVVDLDDGTRLENEDGRITARRGSERLQFGWTPSNRLAIVEGDEIISELKTGLRIEVDKTTYITFDRGQFKLQRRLDIPIKYVLQPQENGGWTVTSAGQEEPITLVEGSAAMLPGDLTVNWEGDQFEASIRRVNVKTKNGFPVSITLGLMAMAVALTIGIPMGIVAALRHNSLIDYGATFFAILGASVPNLVLGPMLIWLFILKLDWFELKWSGNWANFILPAIALGTGMAAAITRLTRASLLQVIGEDYIRTARAKGLAGRTVVLRHALKNSLIPVVTILGPMVANVITGAIITEQIFAIPGMGGFFVESIGNRDYPVVMATTIIFAFLIVLANLAVDITYGILDPRIRYQ